MSFVVEYDESWPREFERIAKELCELLGAAVLSVHHVGSTAIDTVRWSKPVIDTLVEVRDIREVDGAVETRLAGAGFEARGESGIPGRRYFVRAAGAERSKMHVHIFEHGHDQIARHLNFRDYLRCHPEEAKAYSALKTRLASACPGDKRAYQAGKADFIARVDRLAEEERLGEQAS